jgi:iron complex transport system ATP-binding protein
MSGLIQPDLGDVTLSGRTMRGLDRLSVAQRIAFLPQDRVVHWPLAVRAVVALGRLPHGATAVALSPIDDAAIERAMLAMDVMALAARPVDTLSGGERARVLFARALAQEAPIILADEPTAGLDPAHALDLVAVLGRLAAEGRAIAVALHDLTLAARFCHDVVILSGGRVAASGSIGEVLTADRLSQAFGVSMAIGRIDTVPVVVPIAPLSEPR